MLPDGYSRLIPFCNIYSTFLQRAYDQIIHDVALQNLPVIFCLDRAGLVGEDGATHHGQFDLSYLNCIPNLIIFAPRNEIELRNIMFTAQKGLEQPIAIRYPRGKGKITDWKAPFKEITLGQNITLKKGSQIAIISIGTVANNIEDAISSLKNDTRIGHYDFRFLKPLDEKLLHNISKSYDIILTIEDNSIIGGLSSTIASFVAEYNYKIRLERIAIPDTFIEHGTINELQDKIEISTDKIKTTISNLLA